MLKIACLIPYTIRERICEKVQEIRLVSELCGAFRKKKRANPQTVFLVLTPEHTNLGDHAIASAETDLLIRNGMDYVEITGRQLCMLQKAGYISAMNGRPILINGGGNMGTLWFDVEELMRDIISHNPRSPIFILPNTIYYEDTDFGRQEFERSKAIYNAHRNLHIYARESLSYEKMKDVYRAVKLVPDMVLSLNWSDKVTSQVRKGCILCLRNDLESIYTTEQKQQLYDTLKSVFGGDVRFSDMHYSDDVSVAAREDALLEKRMEFQSAQLVVTDRLHGMILCAITGTPCVVVNSVSPKVKGCYEWIKHLEYIRFCETPADILPAIHSVQGKTYIYDNKCFLPYYDDLICDIKKEITGE